MEQISHHAWHAKEVTIAKILGLETYFSTMINTNALKAITVQLEPGDLFHAKQEPTQTIH